MAPPTGCLSEMLSTLESLPTVPALRGLLDLSATELRAWLEARGEAPMRARQLRRWILQRGAGDFEHMSDVPRSLRQELAKSFTPLETRVARHLEASDGTHKVLLRLRDERLIECVLIQEDKRRTACISTQVGCGMGCVFCASGLDGVDRNLSAAEIVEQLVRLRNCVGAVSGGVVSGEWTKQAGTPDSTTHHSRLTTHHSPARLTHIVVMGMGEPLANLDNLLEALDVATAKDGLGIGARHMTISTVGLPAKIRRLADLGKQYHLAVSLHAPNDELRTRIVPTNPKTGLLEILAAADYFFEKTGRQVTFEYVLLGGVNDAASHAQELTRLLKGRHAHVNLIPFNDVPGLRYKRPAQPALTEFVAALRRGSLSVKVRKRKGSDIDAACGQLRRATVGAGEIASSPANP